MWVRIAVAAVALIVQVAPVLVASPPLPEDDLSMAYYVACTNVRAGKDLRPIRDTLWQAIIANPDSYCLRYARQLDEDLAYAIRNPPPADGPPARRLATTRFPLNAHIVLTKPVSVPEIWKVELASDPVMLLLQRDRTVIAELLPALRDRSPTRAPCTVLVSGDVDVIPRVSDAALAIIEAQSGCRFFARQRHAMFHQTPPDVQKQTIDRIEQWWREYKDQPAGAGIRSQLPFAESHHDTIAMAESLIGTGDAKDRAQGVKLLLDMSHRYNNARQASDAATALFYAGDLSALNSFYDEWNAHLGRPGLDLHPYITWYLCRHGGRREWELLYRLAGSPAHPGEDLVRDVFDSGCGHLTPYAIPVLSVGLSVNKHPDVAARSVTSLEKLTGKSFGNGPDRVEQAKKWWLAEGRNEYTYDAIETKLKPKPVMPLLK